MLTTTTTIMTMKVETPKILENRKKMSHVYVLTWKYRKANIAALVGHATVDAYESACRRQPEPVSIWECQAQPKNAVQILSREQSLSRHYALSTFNLCCIRRWEHANCGRKHDCIDYWARDRWKDEQSNRINETVIRHSFRLSVVQYHIRFL